jgi:hypothetical protein
MKALNQRFFKELREIPVSIAMLHAHGTFSEAHNTHAAGVKALKGV